VRIEPCFSPVWDTAIVAVCLRESGVPANHPAMKRAAEWLMAKEIRFTGDWIHKNPAKVEPSGWVFEYNNQWNPDVDDTAMVLLALRKIPTDRPQKRDECFQRGLKWMMTFQCRDGGWAAFDKDCTKNILEKVPFADHNAMLDPATVDITGRILEMLATYGYSKDHPAVKRAIAFIRKEQEPDGSWFGRWGVNYIYGTALVLRGLEAIGMDLHEPCIQQGAEWLRMVQNADGGWGETVGSYDDPTLRGVGDSTPSQTAWAILGLLAANDIRSDSVARGVAYLLRTQKIDGSWDEPFFTGTGFPRVFYLMYHLYRDYFPLLALTTYAKVMEKAER
jgi:squalene-hopene/tetraprenyl-beta-curcumene cyclase